MRRSTGQRAIGKNRRGITILEVVFAVTLLGMTVVTMLSANSYIFGMQGREAQRLGAAELTNRLLLQYVDDKNALPSDALPIEYARWRYRWKLDERRVRVVYDPAATQDESASSGIGPERVRLLVVRVWLSEESGGSAVFSQGVPSVVVSRLYDPLGFEYHSPDTNENQLSTDEGLREIMNEIIELQGGTSGGSP